VGVWRLGKFEWDTSSEALEVTGSLVWRYQVLSDEHMWFKSTIAVTGGHSCDVVVEFVGKGQNIDTWFDGSDDQIGAPTAPAEEEAENVFLTIAKTFGLWLIEEIKALARFLFVPTEEQQTLLMPSGSLGASLLDGTTWGSGSSSWSMTAHWGARVITLISIDFATVSTFTNIIRVILQAGMLLSLIYMVVVLI
jgi:hypothetical protein